MTRTEWLDKAAEARAHLKGVERLCMEKERAHETACDRKAHAKEWMDEAEYDYDTASEEASAAEDELEEAEEMVDEADGALTDLLNDEPLDEEIEQLNHKETP